MYPAYEPNTTLIANGLAGMGFAVPAAIAAKLVRPTAKVVAVSGDGGLRHERGGTGDGQEAAGRLSST